MWCGFGWLLICFSAAVILPAGMHTQLLLGFLAVTGGGLSAFLGRTYIHVYERSLQQLNEYFDQPLLNSYLLSAERIIDGMDERYRDRAYGAVIDRLLEGSIRLSVVDTRAAKSRPARPFLARRLKSPDGASGEVVQESSNTVADNNAAQ